MAELPATSSAPVIRTDFSDEDAWLLVGEKITAVSAEGFQANVTFVDDAEFSGLDATAVLRSVPDGYLDGPRAHSFAVLVDGTALTGPDHPVEVLDLRVEPGRTFRSLPGQIQAIENNLSIANMDFHEFAISVGPDGIFRGF